VANTSGTAVSTSRDGSTVVGRQDSGLFAPFHAFRWTEATGAVDLGTLDPPNAASRSSLASDVSSDGSVVVGFSDTSGGAQHAFRWTQAGGMVDLGAPAGPARSSRALGVSADGGVVVGDADFAEGGGFRSAAFRWTQAGGFQDLGALEAGFPAVATAVTADGAVVVGQASISIVVGNTSTNGTRAFRWTAATGLAAIEPLPGDLHSTATGVSDDGRVVVGMSAAEAPFQREAVGILGGGRAFRWTAATGVQDLRQVLADAGADMAGVTLLSVTGISPDGQWITGQATTPATEPGDTVAFVAQVCDEALGMTCAVLGAAPPLALAAASPSITVVAGQSASTELTVTPGAGFSGAVAFACSGLPRGAACTFAPATVTPAGAPTATTLTVSTDGGPVAAAASLDPRRAAPVAALPLGAVAMLLARRRRAGASEVVGLAREREKQRRAVQCAAIIATALALFVACGGGGGGGGSSPPPGGATGTPAGTSTVVVTATSGSGASAVAASVPLTLTVTR
jgi:probable HAF family extracellular repeat protein